MKPTNIRPFDLLDLATLYRYRSEAISLDSARRLTRGNPVGPLSVMAYVNPRRHLYSAVLTDDGATMVGGVIHTNGESYARLLYLAPASRMDNSAVPVLIEHLATQAGSWGAFHLIAEVDETGVAFTPLRIAGFSVYAWQRMWDVSGLTAGGTDNHWQRVHDINLNGIQNLYHQIVPPLLQPVEPAPKRATGFICDEGVKCYVSTSSGMMGIVLFPLIHPEATDVGAKLLSFIGHLPNRGGRPIYICVRSYQAWLEHLLEDLGAKGGARQAVMVKHLARIVKEEQTVKASQPVGVTVQPSRVSRIEKREP